MELGCAVTSGEELSLNESDKTDRWETSDLLRLSFTPPGVGRAAGG